MGGVARHDRTPALRRDRGARLARVQQALGGGLAAGPRAKVAVGRHGGRCVLRAGPEQVWLQKRFLPCRRVRVQMIDDEIAEQVVLVAKRCCATTVMMMAASGSGDPTSSGL